MYHALSPTRAVLKYRSNSLEYSAYADSFHLLDLSTAEILSGEDYYIDKAVEQGATKPKRATKKK